MLGALVGHILCEFRSFGCKSLKTLVKVSVLFVAVSVQDSAPVLPAKRQEAGDHQADSCGADDKGGAAGCPERGQGPVYAPPPQHHRVL